MAESRDLTAVNFMTGQQVRAVLGISKAKFLELVNSGELDAIKIGSHFRVDEESLRAYILRHRVPPRAAS